MAGQTLKEMFDSIHGIAGNITIQFLLDAGLEINSLNRHGNTMLSYAAEWGNLEITKLLVQKGADGNVKNSKGSKPLHVAAYYGRKDIVKFFLEKGISANSCDNDEWTPLHYVAHNCIEPALRETYQEIVHFLVDSNADLNAVNWKGRTPLLTAAMDSNKFIVELFMKLGASIDGCDKTHRTLLHYSCWHGWLEIVKYLVQIGWQVNPKCPSQPIPLLLAAEYSKCSVVEYLLESGANPNGCGHQGNTVLHYACINGWLDVAKTLIKKGSDINAQNAFRNTSLHLAVYARKTEIIDLLLTAGADCSLENDSGKTAFNVCILRPKFHLEGIKLFIENGTYFQSNDYNALVNTPLHKELVLQNMELCTQAVINHFNNFDLPKIYKIPVVAERLPPIEKLKIENHRKVARDIAESVKYEIQSKGRYDLLNARPIVLSSLCIRSLVEYFMQIQPH